MCRMLQLLVPLLALWSLRAVPHACAQPMPPSHGRALAQAVEPCPIGRVNLLPLQPAPTKAGLTVTPIDPEAPAQNLSAGADW